MRIILESPTGAVFLGVAKGWLRQLQIEREDLKLVVKDKLVTIDGFRVLVRAAEWGDLIWIRGGAAIRHILLTNNSTSSEYDWNSDTLMLIPAPVSETIADIIPIYNTRCQIQEYSSYVYGTGWSTALIGEVPFTFLGGLNNYEMGFFQREDGIYGRIGDTFGHVANSKDTPLLEYAGNFGPLFGLPARKEDDSPWNLFNGIYLRALNPASQKVSPAWYWTPSFFTIQQGDPLLFRGWYYGNNPTLSYEHSEIVEGGDFVIYPLESLKVSFRGLVDTRYQSELGQYQYGWAELVTQVDGEDENDVFVYLQKEPLKIPANESFGFAFSTQDPEDDTFWAGSVLRGFPLAFRVNLDPTVPREDISVDLWNFQIWTNPGAIDAQQDTGVCAVVQYGNKAKVYRYSGFGLLVHMTDSYHSHSYSRDGSLLAVFDGADGVITAVNVFDLFGTRNNDEAEHESGYTAGGFTLVREDGILESVAATSGCVIPFRSADFDEETDLLVLPYDLATAVPDTGSEFDYTDYLPSMSTMQINKLGTRSPIFHNVTCKNGVDAEFGISEDPCFESVVYQEDPNLPVRLDKLVGWWKFIGSDQGVVRGDYSGEIPNVRFNGDENHNGTRRLFTSTLGNLTIAFSFELQQYRCYQALGDCVIEGLNEEGEPIYDCNGVAVLTASTPCQTAELDLSKEVNPLVLIPPSTFNAEESAYEPLALGSFFTATGGVEPYRFLFPGVDPFTGEVVEVDECITIQDPRVKALASVIDTCDVEDSAQILIDRHALSISGTDTPIVGSVYGATGTAPPFTFSFTGGSINSTTGEILSIDTCALSGDSRAAFVSVSDACSISVSIEVRLPGGAWSNQLVEEQDPCIGVTTNAYSLWHYFGKYRSFVAYGRSTNTACYDCDWVPSFPFDAVNSCAVSGGYPFGTCTPTTPQPVCTITPQPGTDQKQVITYAQRYEWVCP